MSASNAHAAFWQADNYAQRGVDAASGYTYSSDDAGLRYFLNQVPNELSGQSLQIDLPMPDGTLATYEIFESGIMQPGLAAKFPQIRSFVVRGVDHPGSTGRVDISQKGFRGMIYTPYGRVFIDPTATNTNRYISRTASKNASESGSFQCSASKLDSSMRATPDSNFSMNFGPVIANRISGSILTYRLAVSATIEYVFAVSGPTLSVNDTMAEINTAINRVNQIYERDLGIRLILVVNNDLLIDVNDEAGFTNESAIDLLDQNQLWIDAKIGSPNYDIGHVLSTSPGGVALVESVCGPDKAQGVSGLGNPTGDIFYVDFIAHEIGHQFGANHTFNGSTGSCGTGARYSTTAFEPGSGSTIMSYAGLCGGENLQSSSDATFHAGSIAEINTFVSDATLGGSCGAALAVIPANSDPVNVNAGGDKVIPAATPFGLVGSATDTDGDVLSYQWDQMDLGEATDLDGFGADLTDNPLFRTYEPRNTVERHFPSVGTQIDNAYDLSETLPCTSRDLNFRLTVRDGRSGQDTDDIKLTVDADAGPFKITSHNLPETIQVNDGSEIIQWDVAGTNTGAINCSSVDIDLLTFSSDSKTYAVTSLEQDVVNDGSALVSLPDKFSGKARFRVSCSDNVFYDISDADLVIQDSGAGNNFAVTGNDVFDNENVILSQTQPQCVAKDLTKGGSSGDSGGGGSFGFWFLLLFSGALPVARVVRGCNGS